MRDDIYKCLFRTAAGVRLLESHYRATSHDEAAGWHFLHFKRNWFNFDQSTKYVVEVEHVSGTATYNVVYKNNQPFLEFAMLLLNDPHFEAKADKPIVVPVVP